MTIFIGLNEKYDFRERERQRAHIADPNGRIHA